MTSKRVGALAGRYLRFPGNKFGIWTDEENFYIGNNNKVIIDGNDLIINDERYKQTHGLWRLLTNPNKKKWIKKHMAHGGLTRIILQKRI